MSELSVRINREALKRLLHLENMVRGYVDAIDDEEGHSKVTDRRLDQVRIALAKLNGHREGQEELESVPAARLEGK